MWQTILNAINKPVVLRTAPETALVELVHILALLAVLRLLYGIVWLDSYLRRKRKEKKIAAFRERWSKSPETAAVIYDVFGK